MAEEAEAAPETGPKPPGIVAKLINGVVVFVMCLGAVVAGGFINAKLHPPPEMKLGPEGKITVVEPVKAEKGEHGEGAAAAAIYFAIDPPLVVNFEDSAAVRFLQITVEVMARDQKAIDGVQKNVPLIRNNLLLLISNRDYKTLMSREGKEKLRQEALTEVRNISKKEGAPPVDDLLFTSFVVQ
jgi:flagellar basal body-associated protein FliL